jgi:hypothetical protein
LKALLRGRRQQREQIHVLVAKHAPTTHLKVFRLHYELKKQIRNA